jgi:hypothetical protein
MLHQLKFWLPVGAGNTWKRPSQASSTYRVPLTVDPNGALGVIVTGMVTL